MNDFRDLKAIAEACQQHQPLRFMRSHGALYIRNDNGIVFDVHQNRSFPEFMAQNKDYADLVLAATPEAILALFAENERLSTDEQEATDLCDRLSDLLRSTAIEVRGPEEPLKRHSFHDLPSRVKTVISERDQLKAENEALRQVLTNSHEFILSDARTRHMCDETGRVSPLFPKRVAVLAAIDAAMGTGERS